MGNVIAVVGRIMVVFCLLASPLAQGGPITVAETQIVNDYPETVTFEVEAASTAGMITSVEFNLTARGGDTMDVEPAEFTPDRVVTARYVLQAGRDGWPPGSPMQYSWTVRDDAGNVFTTEPAEYIIMDARFTWQMLENEDVALWWYEGEAELAQSVFDSAARALVAMEDNTGLPLPYRVHILLYATVSDFGAWREYRREWVWGEAYPGLGVTVQIIPPAYSASVEEWIQDVIPHEIAHLFFFEVTDTPFGMAPPSWLNEGFAQYHEFLSNEDQLTWVRRVARYGELIPLRLLSGSFNGDEDEVHLMYAESLSAVTFLFERWGEEGMGRLLSAYKAGLGTDEALLEAIGLDFAGFELAWWEWLGGQPGMYPTRVPTAEPPTPQPVWTMARLPTAVPTGTPTSTLEPTETSTAMPTATETPIATPTVTRRVATPPTPITDLPEGSSSGAPCLGVFGLVAVAAVLGWRRPAH